VSGGAVGWWSGQRPSRCTGGRGVWCQRRLPVCAHGERQRPLKQPVNESFLAGACRDKRPARWRFARGPLPEGLPLPQLDSPWFLLSI
jgi:hypothetical protein